MGHETTDNKNTGTESDGKLNLAGILCVVISICCFVLGFIFAVESKIDPSSYKKYATFNWATFVKSLLLAGCYFACGYLFDDLRAAVSRLAGAKITSSSTCGVMRVISYLGILACVICGCLVLFWLDEYDFKRYVATVVLGNLSLYQIAPLFERGFNATTLKILVGLGFIFAAVPYWCAAQFFRGLGIVIGAIKSGTVSVSPLHNLTDTAPASRQERGSSSSSAT